MPRCHSVARAARERALRMIVRAPSASSFLSRISPWRLMPPWRRFKPLEAPRGVKPHQAATSRDEANCLPSPMAVTMACAVKLPMPGMVASRRIAGSALATAMILASMAALATRSWSICCSIRRRTDSSIAGIRSSPAATSWLSSAKPRRPGAATMPSSASWLRTLLISWVCCLTSSSRDRSSPREAWLSTLLIATNRMSGRPTAVHIAAASRASFLLRRLVAPACCAGLLRRLVAPDERLHVGRRDQAHIVTQGAQLPAPVMGRAARLEPNQRRLEPGEKRQNLRSPQPLLHNDLPARALAVNREHRSRDIQPDRDPLHRYGLRRWSFIATPAWHTRCRQRAVHPALRGTRRATKQSRRSEFQRPVRTA